MDNYSILAPAKQVDKIGGLILVKSTFLSLIHYCSVTLTWQNRVQYLIGCHGSVFLFLCKSYLNIDFLLNI